MNIARLKRELEDARKIAASRTVILWGPEDLLGNAVAALLTARSNWNVIRVQNDADIEALTCSAGQLKPELLFVNRAQIAGNYQPLLRLVQNCPELKILAVNPENNLIDIYDKHMFHLKNIADLLEILDEPVKPTPKGGTAAQSVKPDPVVDSPVNQAGKLKNTRSKNDNP